ncbi:acetoacetyl-CoA synthase, putative [Coccidioides posadasii C735 delta SOWgp]|uniref:Acetoacetyl-CoA synthase, putative n=1 Tax=Coccidioides posadasii (strain C735) TaxID=222929 RepID=C5PCT9_COCP7|nr:acetoacetyl-CoA synthase, putative [Coccidioides posadasii C735 delta SOWgp]EER24900.1 acetoacetyl-CoA synthase, putative [Coccidioides posadasii C735 delta SOWgp]|eukprot:XP_003067045.1 acetoacetyl-CoA synthase, putative [Coccidioides posadasii C735 delta SOWgp]
MPFIDRTNGMGDYAEDARELWRPANPEATSIHEFKSIVASKHAPGLESYHDLWQWSVDEPAKFWEEVWNYTGVKAHRPYEEVCQPEALLFPKRPFFDGSLLNFAENLLFPSSNPHEHAVAVIAATESTREHISWKDLRERVRLCIAAMRDAGVAKGDRVAGFVGNHPNTLIAMLATTSIGALWSGVSTDTGVHAVLERLRQIEPKLLFADNASIYNGKVHDTHAKVAEVAASLPCLQLVVIFDAVRDHAFDVSSIVSPNGSTVTYADFIASARTSDAPLRFEYLPPDHPIYILYSSGTTGAPKPIVHGALGTLLQHKKEHVLHCDIGPGDRLFYFTTTTWMMWHWLVSALASGSSIVLYDGSPFRPLDPENGKGDMAMARLIDELHITHFGTSAKYLSVLEQAALNPRKHPHRPVTFRTLRAIFSTGSPLAPSTFDYVYSSIHEDILLGSITGGTDIISLFGACCPILPVHRGEIQCRGLGMAVSVFDHAANDISKTDDAGDLVCTKPFPAQPVMFWPPGAVGEAKYRSSYFETYGDHTWHHGDFVKINPVTGGLVMLGRSDGVLKPAGVRFGSAEIYNVILKHFADEIEDSLCIGRRRNGIETDETVVLFVKLTSTSSASSGVSTPNGVVREPPTLPDGLAARIQAVIRKELSPRHVPAIIDSCPEIPVTSNGKKIENAVKQILCGLNIKTGASVANAACLEWYRKWAAEH